MEKVNRFKALPPHLGIKIYAARRKATVFENCVHNLRRQIDIRWKLIGVPAYERIACIGVNGT